MPDALELPRMGSPVVPLMRAGLSRVAELVPHRFPGAASVIRALRQLAMPVRPLRSVDPVRIDRRTLEVHHLHSAEVRTLDPPLPPRGVGAEDEGSLLGTDQHAYFRHHARPSAAGSPSERRSSGLRGGTCEQWPNPRARFRALLPGRPRRGARTDRSERRPCRRRRR